MSAASTQQQSKSRPFKEVIGWIITISIVIGGTIISQKVGLAIMETKFNDYKKEIELSNQFNQKQLDVINEHSKDQDKKIDLILDGIHRIELQLKDKQDRPQ